MDELIKRFVEQLEIDGFDIETDAIDEGVEADASYFAFQMGVDTLGFVFALHDYQDSLRKND